MITSKKQTLIKTVFDHTEVFDAFLKEGRKNLWRWEPDQMIWVPVTSKYPPFWDYEIFCVSSTQPTHNPDEEPFL